MAQSNEKDIKAQLAAALQKRVLDLANEKGRNITLSEFALHYDIPYTSLSIWINQQRLPNNDNALKLAHLFPEIGRILGIQIMPAAVANDPLALELMAKWDRLTDAQRTPLRAVLDQYQGEGNHKHQHATAGGAA